MVTRLPAGQRSNRGSIPGSVKRFSVLQNIQAGSVYHPASYSVGTKGAFPGIKRYQYEAYFSLQWLGQEGMELYFLPLPHMSPCTKTNLTSYHQTKLSTRVQRKCLKDRLEACLYEGSVPILKRNQNSSFCVAIIRGYVLWNSVREWIASLPISYRADLLPEWIYGLSSFFIILFHFVFSACRIYIRFLM
jgi:hypothetical protein